MVSAWQDLSPRFEDKWQDYPTFCYEINGRKLITHATCGTHYSRTQACDWTPGGGKRLFVKSGQETYLTFNDQYTDARRARSFFKPNLLGGKVTFTIDTHQMGCDCIGQVSLVAMPGMTEFGEFDQIANSHFACDARGQTGNNVCPEFTILEANKYGFKATPRACPGYSVLGHWDKCDGEGDAPYDVYGSKDFTYGPGGDIDTNSPIDVQVEFHADGDTLTGYSVTLSQGDKSFTKKV